MSTRSLRHKPYFVVLLVYWAVKVIKVVHSAPRAIRIWLGWALVWLVAMACKIEFTISRETGEEGSQILKV